jgi:hypothetical protein
MIVESIEVGQPRVLEQQRSEGVGVNRDVAHGLGRRRRDQDGLSREQIQLAQKARASVADDLGAGSIDDRDLALDDRDERNAPVADAIQRLPSVRGPLFPQLGEFGQLRGGERRAGGRRRDRSSGLHRLPQAANERR